jgi:hypothetical protein
VKFSRYLIKRNRTSIITASHNISLEGSEYKGEKQMNKTLIVLGAGIWGVLILLRFVLSSVDSNTFQLLNILEIVAFVITIVGIVKRD